jgi:hypothetical protein
MVILLCHCLQMTVKNFNTAVKSQITINKNGTIIHKVGYKKGSRHDYNIYKMSHPVILKEVVNRSCIIRNFTSFLQILYGSGLVMLILRLLKRFYRKQNLNNELEEKADSTLGLGGFHGSV